MWRLRDIFVTRMAFQVYPHKVSVAVQRSDQSSDNAQCPGSQIAETLTGTSQRYKCVD